MYFLDSLCCCALYNDKYIFDGLSCFVLYNDNYNLDGLCDYMFFIMTGITWLICVLYNEKYNLDSLFCYVLYNDKFITCWSVLLFTGQQNKCLSINICLFLKTLLKLNPELN